MKFRVVGGPVKGNVTVEGKHSDKFEKVFKKIEKAVGKGVWETHQLFPGTILEGTRRAVPLPTLIRPEDTPDSLKLEEDKKGGTPVLLMLRDKSASLPPALSEYAKEAQAEASVTPPRPDASPSSDHQTQPDSALVTPAATPRENGSQTADTNAPGSAVSYHDRLVAIYSKYEPGKLHTVPGTLKKFKGREEAVIKQLVKKYGPEPPVSSTPASVTAPATPAAPQPEAAAPATPPATLTASGTANAPVSPSPPPAPQVQSPQDTTVATPPPTVREDSAPSSPQLTEGSPTAGASPPSSPRTNTAEAGGASYHDRLTAIYAKYDPAKVKLVDGTLRKFKGKEEAVIRQLVKKYGPEPTVEAAAPTATVSPAATLASSTAAVYRDAITAILLKYDPENVAMVEPLLERYAGQEETVVKRLLEKYEPANVTSDNKDEAAISTEVTSPAGAAAVVVTPPSESLPAAATEEPEEVQPAVPPSAPADEPVATVTLTPIVESPPTETNDPADAEDAPPVGAEARKTAPPSPDPEEAEAVAEPEAPAAVEVGPVVPETAVVATHDMARSESPRDRSLEVTVVSPPTAATHEDTAVTRTSGASAPQTGAAKPPPPPPVHPQESEDFQEESRTAPRTPFNTPVASNAQAQSIPFPRHASVAIAPAVHHCAALMADEARQAVQRRYWAKWQRFLGERAAEEALARREWVLETRQGIPSYRLNDTVEPAFVVKDLAAYKVLSAGKSDVNRDFSDSVLIGLRALIASLVQAFQGQVVEVSSTEDEEMLNTFVRTWQNPASLCPVHDGPELARALHQAAQLLSQLEDLMAVTKTQSEQLQELKMMHEELTEQLEEAQQNAAAVATADTPREERRPDPRVETLQRTVADRDATIKTLSAQLADCERKLAASQERQAAAADAAPMRSPRATHATASQPGASASTTLRKHLAATEREVELKDSQVAQLQQELAKARTLLHRSREKNEQLAQDLRASTTTEERLRRDLLAARQPSRSASLRSPRAGQRTRSAPRGVTVTPAGFSSPGFGLEHTPHGRVSPRQAHPSSPSLSAIRHPTLSAERRDQSPDALHASQLTGATRDGSWPRSRYLPPPTDIERGPCPNCLTPLVSCSPSVSGPAEETAAFCFSCRRAFTFGDLVVRDKVADMGQL